MTDKETMQQALEVLKSAAIFVDSFRGQKATQEAITALSEALAQPEQEPVAWMYTSRFAGNQRYITRIQYDLTTYKADKVWPLYTTPPAAQQEQEPCIGKDPRCPCQDGDACHYKDCGNTKARPVAQPEQEPVAKLFGTLPVFDTPPAAQRTWVGLDEDDIRKLYGKDLNYRDGNYVRYAMAVEAKLKEKNDH